MRSKYAFAVLIVLSGESCSTSAINGATAFSGNEFIVLGAGQSGIHEKIRKMPETVKT